MVISVLRLRELTSRGKRLQNVKERGEKSVRHTHFCCSSTGPARGGRGPCARAFPRAKFNQTGSQRASGSPLAPLLGDVWLYGLLHVADSTAVDLATGLL